MHRVLSCLTLLAILGLVGCGGPGGPPLAPASGTLTHKGAPVEGATVTFLVEGSPLVASGVTDAQGKFTLTTGGRDGAPIGKAQIGVSKLEQGSAPAAPADAKEASTKMASGAPMMTSEMQAKNLLPAKYVTPNLSGLTETVTAEGPNNFTIDLQD